MIYSFGGLYLKNANNLLFMMMTYIQVVSDGAVCNLQNVSWLFFFQVSTIFHPSSVHSEIIQLSYLWNMVKKQYHVLPWKFDLLPLKQQRCRLKTCRLCLLETCWFSLNFILNLIALGFTRLVFKGGTLCEITPS